MLRNTVRNCAPTERWAELCLADMKALATYCSHGA